MPITVRGNSAHSGRTYDTRASRKGREAIRDRSCEAGASTATSSHLPKHPTSKRWFAAEEGTSPNSGRGNTLNDGRNRGTSAPRESSPVNTDESDTEADIEMEEQRKRIRRQSRGGLAATRFNNDQGDITDQDS
eukprot:GHVU01016890.1.p1 GENE.GHVU01016890.1~~GHVU01016890.1.p1  ORF type:complete len:134 (-),score=11.48 GHVU01016890.1:168-569(-)